MPIEIIQSALWPGVLGVESCSGTISHGISPAVFVITTDPQLAAPAESGSLVITDGFQALTLRDCKADVLKGRYGSDGQTWVLTILDRRWKWRGARISGRYNQLDPRGKLVPWTVRSPEELATLCLEAMGEKNYVIRLPPGLKKADGEKVERFLRPGENFAQSLANPRVSWDVIPPAEALAQLADSYGCRVVYQPFRDRVIVVPLGEGDPLPEGPCELIAPSLDSPETPDAVAVAGAPVRVQMRLLLEPVGEEWDGEILPINELSYAPPLAEAVQISTATFSGSGSPTLSLDIITNPGPDEIRWAIDRDAAFGTVAAKLASMQTQIEGTPGLNAVVSPSASSTVLTLRGREVGVAFGAECSSIDIVAPDTWTAGLTQVAVPKGAKSWNACRPPNFGPVVLTERLSYSEAVALARKSVFRRYRVKFVDPATGKTPLKAPWYGELTRRQQLILQPTKVEQVVPAPRLKGGRDKDVVGGDPRRDPLIAAIHGGILPDFYNGYSRDQPATVTGAIKRLIGSVLWNVTGGLNTEATDKVYVGFTVNPVEQTVDFAEYVYRLLAVAGPGLATIEPATLVLETAVLITDAKTGELVRWEEQQRLGGSGTTEWAIRDDVQVSVVGTYRPATSHSQNSLAGYTFADRDDARARAKFYLDGMAKKYRLEGGETRSYIGIVPIDPDGFIQQVSWSVGPGGATTTASTNSEHSDVIPSYPARRRAENLSPNAQAKMANLAERDIRAQIFAALTVIGFKP